MSWLVPILLGAFLSCVLVSSLGAGFDRQSDEHRQRTQRVHRQIQRLEAERHSLKQELEHTKKLMELLPTEAKLLADRCDQQAKWLSEGDPRGIYGEYLPHVYVDWPGLGIENTEQTLADCLHPEPEELVDHEPTIIFAEPEETPKAHVLAQVMALMAQIPGPMLGTPDGGNTLLLNP